MLAVPVVLLVGTFLTSILLQSGFFILHCGIAITIFYCLFTWQRVDCSPPLDIIFICALVYQNVRRRAHTSKQSKLLAE